MARCRPLVLVEAEGGRAGAAGAEVEHLMPRATITVVVSGGGGMFPVAARATTKVQIANEGNRPVSQAVLNAAQRAANAGAVGIIDSLTQQQRVARGASQRSGERA